MAEPWEPECVRSAVAARTTGRLANLSSPPANGAVGAPAAPGLVLAALQSRQTIDLVHHDDVDPARADLAEQALQFTL